MHKMGEQLISPLKILLYATCLGCDYKETSDLILSERRSEDPISERVQPKVEREGMVQRHQKESKQIGAAKFSLFGLLFLEPTFCLLIAP